MIPHPDLMTGMSENAARAAVIDIASQPYDKYSEYWKEQNSGGPEFLIRLMDEWGNTGWIRSHR